VDVHQGQHAAARRRDLPTVDFHDPGPHLGSLVHQSPGLGLVLCATSCKRPSPTRGEVLGGLGDHREPRHAPSETGSCAHRTQDRVRTKPLQLPRRRGALNCDSQVPVQLAQSRGGRWVATSEHIEVDAMEEPSGVHGS